MVGKERRGQRMGCAVAERDSVWVDQGGCGGGSLGALAVGGQKLIQSVFWAQDVDDGDDWTKTFFPFQSS